MLDMRSKKLGTFGLNAIEENQPEALMEEVFVPLFLMHRYQIEATSKLLGGLDYTYKIKGDNQKVQSRLEASKQNAALDALLYTIQPEQLAVPNQIIDRLPPRPMGYSRNRETFPSRNGLNFDPLAPGENIVDMTFGFMFEAGRANRLHQQKLFESSLPSFTEVLDKTIQQVFGHNFDGTYQGEINLMVQNKLTDHLISLSNNPRATATVKAISRNKLREIAYLYWNKDSKTKTDASKTLTSKAINEDFNRFLADKINNFLNQKEEFSIPAELAIPDGAPIGTTDLTCDFEY
jgi:hypothetical protein